MNKDLRQEIDKIIAGHEYCTVCAEKVEHILSLVYSHLEKKFREKQEEIANRDFDYGMRWARTILKEELK
jgi:hypothetical protein